MSTSQSATRWHSRKLLVSETRRTIRTARRRRRDRVTLTSAGRGVEGQRRAIGTVRGPRSLRRRRIPAGRRRHVPGAAYVELYAGWTVLWARRREDGRGRAKLRATLVVLCRRRKRAPLRRREFRRAWAVRGRERAVDRTADGWALRSEHRREDDAVWRGRSQGRQISALQIWRLIAGIRVGRPVASEPAEVAKDKRARVRVLRGLVEKHVVVTAFCTRRLLRGNERRDIRVDELILFDLSLR